MDQPDGTKRPQEAMDDLLRRMRAAEDRARWLPDREASPPASVGEMQEKEEEDGGAGGAVRHQGAPLAAPAVGMEEAPGALPPFLGGIAPIGGQARSLSDAPLAEALPADDPRGHEEEDRPILDAKGVPTMPPSVLPPGSGGRARPMSGGGRAHGALASWCGVVAMGLVLGWGGLQPWSGRMQVDSAEQATADGRGVDAAHSWPALSLGREMGGDGGQRVLPQAVPMPVANGVEEGRVLGANPLERWLDDLGLDAAAFFSGKVRGRDGVWGVEVGEWPGRGTAFVVARFVEGAGADEAAFLSLQALVRGHGGGWKRVGPSVGLPLPLSPENGGIHALSDAMGLPAGEEGGGEGRQPGLVPVLVGPDTRDGNGGTRPGDAARGLFAMGLQDASGGRFPWVVSFDLSALEAGVAPQQAVAWAPWGTVPLPHPPASGIQPVVWPWEDAFGPEPVVRPVGEMDAYNQPIIAEVLGIQDGDRGLSKASGYQQTLVGWRFYPWGVLRRAAPLPVDTSRRTATIGLGQEGPRWLTDQAGRIWEHVRADEAVVSRTQGYVALGDMWWRPYEDADASAMFAGDAPVLADMPGAAAPMMGAWRKEVDGASLRLWRWKEGRVVPVGVWRVVDPDWAVLFEGRVHVTTFMDAAGEKVVVHVMDADRRGSALVLLDTLQRVPLRASLVSCSGPCDRYVLAAERRSVQPRETMSAWEEKANKARQEREERLAAEFAAAAAAAKLRAAGRDDDTAAQGDAAGVGGAEAAPPQESGTRFAPEARVVPAPPLPPDGAPGAPPNDAGAAPGPSGGLSLAPVPPPSATNPDVRMAAPSTEAVAPSEGTGAPATVPPSDGRAPSPPPVARATDPLAPWKENLAGGTPADRASIKARAEVSWKEAWSRLPAEVREVWEVPVAWPPELERFAEATAPFHDGGWDKAGMVVGTATRSVWALDRHRLFWWNDQAGWAMLDADQAPSVVADFLSAPYSEGRLPAVVALPAGRAIVMWIPQGPAVPGQKAVVMGLHSDGLHAALRQQEGRSPLRPAALMPWDDALGFGPWERVLRGYAWPDGTTILRMESVDGRLADVVWDMVSGEVLVRMSLG